MEKQIQNIYKQIEKMHLNLFKYTDVSNGMRSVQKYSDVSRRMDSTAE